MPELPDKLLDRYYHLHNDNRDVAGDADLYAELLHCIPREVRNHTTRYLSFVCFMNGISSAGAATPVPPSSSSSSPAPTARAPLTLLNQGTETAEVYRTLLASYLGVPSVDRELVTELSCLKRLSVALARRGLS